MPPALKKAKEKVGAIWSDKLWPFLRGILPSDAKELFLYILIAGLFTLILLLFHYTSIHWEVRSTSKCYKERQKYFQNGIYSVAAKTGSDTPLYNVNYNIASRNFDFKCACPAGETMNTFKNVKVYNLKNNTSTRIDKTCECDRDYTTGNPVVYYDGFPDVVRYMVNDDATFFKSKNPAYLQAS